MIHIERPAAPEFLTDPNRKWVKEIEKAKKHYEDPNAKAFEFSAYNDPELKAALKEVFKKCAYCETNYGAVYDGDVEHFRPKGKVSEKNPQTPGYYWLANDWDNLLMSCQHCNQRRNHVVEALSAAVSLGKLDQFPLIDETKRAMTPDDEIAEEESVRLLLHPCKDRPEEHFEYEDKESVMIPLSERAKTSIEVYALRRPELVRARKILLIALFQQIVRVMRELERFNRSGSDDDKQVFEEELDLLIKFTEPEANYAGMSRYFIKLFLAANNLA